MSELLVKAFPCIESISIEQSPSCRIHYSIESINPVIGINTDWTLTSDGRLLSKHCFADHVVNSLHALRVPSCYISPALRDTVGSLPYDLLAAYDVSWVSDQEVYVTDKNQSGFSLLCSAQSLPTLKHLDRWQKIKTELVSNDSIENRTKKKGSSHWIADMRFKNQIIVYFELGSSFLQIGANNGGQRYG